METNAPQVRTRRDNLPTASFPLYPRQKRWIEQKAGERGVSQATVVRELIDSEMASETPDRKDEASH